MLVQVWIIALALGKDRFGIWLLAVTWATTVRQVLDLRVWETITRFVTQYRAQSKTHRAGATIRVAFIVEATTSAFAFGVVYSTAEFVADLLLKDPAAANVIRVSALFTLTSCVSEPARAVLRVADWFRVSALQSFLRSSMCASAVVAACFYSPSVVGVMAAAAFAGLIGEVVLFVAAFGAVRAMDLHISGTEVRAAVPSVVREQMKFLGSSSVVGICGVVVTRLDILVVGALGTPAAAGVYGLARRVVNQSSLVIQPLQDAVFPDVARIYVESEEELQKFLFSLTCQLSLVVAPMCVLLSIIAPLAIPWVFGRDFIGAGLIAQILVWQLLWVPLIWFRGYLFVRDRLLLGIQLVVLDASICGSALLLLVPMYGAYGAAWAVVIRSWIWCVTSLIVIRSEANQPKSRAHRGTERSA
jgi:O-antigen/teichoic acid export membrane protein